MPTSRDGPPATAAQPALFALHGSEALGASVARAAGVELGRHEEREFERGEHKTRPLSPVRGRPVAVLHAVHGDLDGPSVNDKLLRLWFFVAALRDGGAVSITVIVPYLPYSRKDRRTQAGDPISSRYVAQHFEAAGIDTLVCVEPHNLAAFENSFRRCTLPIPLAAVLEEWLATCAPGNAWSVVSPDAGGMKRAQLVRERMAERLGPVVEIAFVEKRRQNDLIAGGRLAGEVRGRSCVIVDDLASSGATLAQAALACRVDGAREITVAVAHGLFLPEALDTLTAGGVGSVVVTDSVPGVERALAPLTVIVLPLAGILAAALRHVWWGEQLPWVR